MCLIEGSLFKIIYNRVKYSFLSADLVVLLMLRLSPDARYLHCWFNSNDFSSYHYWVGCFLFANPKAQSNIITEFVDNSYHWCKLIVPCSKEFKIIYEQEIWNSITLAINSISKVACVQYLWKLFNPGLFQFKNSDVANSILLVVISLFVASVILLMEVLYSVNNSASLLHSCLFINSLLYWYGFCL